MRKTRLALFCGAAVVALGVAGCDRPAADADVAATTETPVETTMPADQVPATPETLTLANGSQGQYLADASGRAVYMLEGDAACTGDCLAVWPPVIVDTTTPTVASSLQAGLVSAVQRDDGSMQLTYNGHPLYYYAKDTGAAMAMGHDVTDDFGEWYLVGPAGVAVADTDGSAEVTAEAPMDDAGNDMSEDDMDATDVAPPPTETGGNAPETY
jgi:predicted lipoprotein with Yx(FWY)xxD motif